MEYGSAATIAPRNTNSLKPEEQQREKLIKAISQVIATYEGFDPNDYLVPARPRYIHDRPFYVGSHRDLEPGELRDVWMVYIRHAEAIIGLFEKVGFKYPR